MARYLIFIWVVLFLFGKAGPGQTQDQSNEGGILENIKMQILSANEKNMALKEENAQLREQFKGLQRKVSQSEEEVKELEAQYPKRVKFIREQSDVFPQSVTGSVGPVSDDPLIDEAQELYLSGQAIDLSDEQELRELYLYDLQYKKQILQLDLRDLKILYKEVEEKRKQELDIHEKEIREIISEENEIHSKIMELERAAMTYPQEIDLLKMENKGLENTIRRLKK